MAERGAYDESPPTPPLSPAGRARRDAMLGELLDAVPPAAARRRRRRAAVRAGGALALVVVVGGVWWRAAPRSQNATIRPTITAIPGPTDQGMGVPDAAFRVELVATDATVVARLTAPAVGAARVETIDDDALLRTLSAIGRPAGLTRDGERVALTADVVDPPLPAS